MITFVFPARTRSPLRALDRWLIRVCLDVHVYCYTYVQYCALLSVVSDRFALFLPTFPSCAFSPSFIRQQMFVSAFVDRVALVSDNDVSKCWYVDPGQCLAAVYVI